ncbi:MAG TPA: PASTA domain-containing protein [Gaiellaceae bacterium]|nr:PASTA domain-containing protein [Gaiellaceae bacterium]
MAEPPPTDPREPREPADDETVIVPPDRSVEETVISDGWGPESEVFAADGTVVEETETAPPRKPLLWPWLLALLVAVLAGIGAYVYFTQQDETTVPAVTGMRQEPAEAAVRDAGLEPESTQQQSSKPAGIVLGQSPDAGAEVDEGSSVRLVVSTGPPRETVPDVVGETRSEAVDALAAAGFESDVTEAFSDKKAGIVVSQEPGAGSQLDEGGTVTLTVSKGGRPVIVPDVVGTTSSEATAKLEAAGLKANVVAVPSSEPAGNVVAQSPAPGKDAHAGDTVRVNVARAAGTTTTQPAATTPPPGTTTEPTTTAAPEPTTVPDAVGKELADGATAFAAAGLKVGVKYVPSEEPQGQVIAQAKTAGSEAERGDTVQVNVSIGAEPAPDASVPSVAGRRLDEARQALDQAGFEALALDLSGDELRNASAIGSQTPAGGARIPGGSLVILYVRA